MAIAEHGLVPSNVAARMTLAADPAFLQGAVAAGILGAGAVILGAAEDCARMLESAQRRIEAGELPRPLPEALRASIGKPAGEFPASGTPCTDPSTPARSGSSSSPTQEGSRARISC